MEESVKYFVPDISDIRVGYECECLWCCQEPRPWVPITITKEDNMDTKSLPFGIEVVWRLEEGEIRVPYLTKEQIEAEGWIYSERNNYKYFEKGNYFMAWYPEKRLVDFILKDPSIEDRVWNPERFRFFCECKDINTFRYICKLLGV